MEELLTMAAFVRFLPLSLKCSMCKDPLLTPIKVPVRTISSKVHSVHTSSSRLTICVLLMSNFIMGLRPHMYLQIMILPFIHTALYSLVLYRKTTSYRR